MRNTQRVFEQKGYTVTTPPANVVDRSRYGNNATLSGGAVYKKVRDLYVLDFTSATAKATIAKNSSIDNLAQFTFRCWVYYAGAGGNNAGRIFSKTQKQFYIYGGAKNLLFSSDFSTQLGYWQTPNNGLTVGNWYSVQLTYDVTNVANNPVIMINGVSVSVSRSQAPIGTVKSNSAYDLILGNISNDLANLNGYLSHVELRQGIATVAEGKRWYNATCLNFGLNQIP